MIEGLSFYIKPRLRLQPGRYRRYDETRTSLNIESKYYLARGSRGPTLIPYDDFLEEVEKTLWICTKAGGGEH